MRVFVLAVVVRSHGVATHVFASRADAEACLLEEYMEDDDVSIQDHTIEEHEVAV